MSNQANPYDALDLDPSLPLADLTEHLRELAESSNPQARSHIQGLWQRLTLRRDDRIRFALLTRPRPELPSSPQAVAKRLRIQAPKTLDLPALRAQVRLEELLVWPRYQPPKPPPTQADLWPHDNLRDDPFFR